MVNLLRPLTSRLIVPVLLLQVVHGADILFLFGGGNYSHKMSIWPLVIALTQKGHNVTFVSSSSKQPKPDPNVRDLSPKFLQEEADRLYPNVDRIQERKDNVQYTMALREEQILDVCKLTFTYKDDLAFTHIIDSEKFDLVIIDHIFGECGFFLAHRLAPKHIMFDSTTVFTLGMFGLQLENSWIPDLRSRIEYPMTFWGRLKTMYSSVSWYKYSTAFQDKMRELYMKRFDLSDAPSFQELLENTSLILVNSHYSVDFARSLPPLYVNVGGMSSWDHDVLIPQRFKHFMNSYEDGVILISFGSTLDLNTLTDFYLKIFFNMMKKFDQIGFIWRWNGPLPDKRPKNLLAEKWLPQGQILRDSCVRAFITHSGMNSIQEATFGGVPVISMPMFGDQDYLAYRVQAMELGIRLEAATLSQETLDDSINEILNNPKYKKNMMTLSKLYRDRPNPAVTAMEAVEFVLRHDDLTPLKPMELHQSFWVRQHIDVYFFCFSILSVINFLIAFTIYWICKKFV